MAATSYKYKLIYFNFMGRAELSRYILAYCNINYEDIRVAIEDWGTDRKQSTPFGVLPVLEFDDNRTLSGGLNIARYLAETHGLAASSISDEDQSYTNSKLFAVIDAVQDAFSAFAAPLMEKNEEDKVVKRKEAIETKLPFYLSKFEELLNPGPYIQGDQVSYADFYLQIFVDQISIQYPEIQLSISYPRLSKLSQSIIAIPQIANWLKCRPECKYSYYF